MTTPETPAEVLAEMKDRYSGDAHLMRWHDRLDRSLAAGRVAPYAYALEHDDVETHLTRSRAVAETMANSCGHVMIPLYTAPPADPALRGPEQVLQLLIAGGFVDAWKVEKARAIIAGCEPAKASEPDALRVAVNGLRWVADSDPDEANGDTVPEIRAHAQQVLRQVEAMGEKGSGSAPDVSDEAIERALDAKLGPDHTLRKLIRGDTMAVGYGKVDVVRALLAELGSTASAPEVTVEMIERARQGYFDAVGGIVSFKGMRAALTAALEALASEFHRYGIHRLGSETLASAMWPYIAELARRLSSAQMDKQRGGEVGDA